MVGRTSEGAVEPRSGGAKPRSRAKPLAGLFLFLLLASVARGLVFGTLFTWSTASTLMLAGAGLLLAESLRRYGLKLPHAPAARAAVVAVGLATVAMLFDVIR